MQMQERDEWQERKRKVSFCPSTIMKDDSLEPQGTLVALDSREQFLNNYNRDNPHCIFAIAPPTFLEQQS